MKRIIPVFFCLLSIAAATSEARSLSPDEALARVRESTGNAVLKVREATMHSPRLAARDSISGTYYIFSTSEHSIIVGADDIAPALLGYTDTPTENTSAMPPQMQLWLKEYSRQIEWAREHHESPAYHAAEADTRAPIEPLCTTRWGQDHPYNILCPSLNGERTVTGCVATAMAQIMRYHKYPQHGFGSKSYKWNGEEMFLDFTGYNFNWDNMPDEVNGDFNDADAADEIGRLLKTCGFSVEMDYNTSDKGGSGARDDNVPGAFINHFDYDKGLHLEYRDFYTAEDWNDMVYESLATGPVYYGGVTLSGGGHAFVCDGYDADGYFHINWGWNGNFDGFFLLSALDPGGHGTGGSTGGYNFRQSAVLDIRPPFEGSVPAKPYMAVYQNMTCSTSNMLVRFGGGFYNMSGITGHFTIRMMVEDTKGGIHYSKKYYEDDVPSFIGASVLDFDFPEELPDGIYRIRPVYCLDNDDLWTEFKVSISTPSSFNVTLANGKVTVGGEFEVAGIVAPEVTPEKDKWYNLNGIEIDPSHLTPGLYIKATGGKRCLTLIK